MVIVPINIIALPAARERYSATISIVVTTTPMPMSDIKILPPHVNFTALERYGELHQLQKVGFTQQGTISDGFGFGRIALMNYPAANLTPSRFFNVAMPYTS